MTSYNNTKTNITSQRRNASANSSFPCFTCSNIIFNTKVALNTHLIEVHPHPCSDCNEVFESGESRRTHVCEMRQQLFLCRHCDQNFSTHDDLMEHIVEHKSSRSAEQKQSQCKNCEKTFATWDLLKTHLTNDCFKPCVCKKCDSNGVLYETHDSLIAHLKSAHSLHPTTAPSVTSPPAHDAPSNVKVYFEVSCKFGLECRGCASGKCPRNHSTYSTEFITMHDDIPSTICRGEKPHENKRCIRSVCRYDHFKGFIKKEASSPVHIQPSTRQPAPAQQHMLPSQMQQHMLPSQMMHMLPSQMMHMLPSQMQQHMLPSQMQQHMLPSQMQQMMQPQMMQQMMQPHMMQQMMMQMMPMFQQMMQHLPSSPPLSPTQPQSSPPLSPTHPQSSPPLSPTQPQSSPPLSPTHPQSSPPLSPTHPQSSAAPNSSDLHDATSDDN
jgi:hypothetical protein